jgi:glycosyltransferase involved in cell wall biosynthesis
VKIGAWLEQPLSVGGGFHQSVTGVLLLKRLLNPGDELRIYTPVASNVIELAKLGIAASYVRVGWCDRILGAWLASSCAPAFQGRLRLRTKLEKTFARDGVDVVFFAAPSTKALWLQSTPFIFTLWDVCHLDHPEFHEVRDFGEFERREGLFSAAVRKAYLTLVDSEVSRGRVAARYGADPARLLALPYSPSPFLTVDSPISSKWGEGYFFYPAQFWPHKNHRRLLEALAQLAQDSDRPRLVFAGGDHGGRPQVEAVARQLGVEGQVTFTGYVDSADLGALYRGAAGLLMPSYFGPTNIPPLEAWSCGIPVACSRDAVEHAGGAALVLDPDNASEWAQAMKDMRVPATKAKLITAGTARLHDIAQERSEREKELAQALRKLSLRLGTQS